MVMHCISIFNHLLRYIKKTKYTTTCNVKSSTIYKVNSILQLHLCSQNEQNFERPIFDSAKTIFFGVQDKFIFSYFTFLSLDIFYLKSKIYHKMQREKLYNLQSKAYFNCILLVFKKKQNPVRPFSLPRENFFLIPYIK